MSRQWAGYWLLVGGLAIAAALLLAAEVAGAHPAVGRVAATGAHARCYGSGTLIHKDGSSGIVLTCEHVPRDGTDITVTFSDGRRYAAKLLASDKAWDLAALAIAPPEADPVAIAAEHPKQGDPLTSCGYGSDGQYWCNQGRALGYVRTAATQTFETLELSGSARDGDSGGPVFNAAGELVAVVWGTNGRIVEGTYCGRVRKFLAGVFGGRVAAGRGCGRPDCPNCNPQCPADGSCPQAGGGNQPIPGAMPLPGPASPPRAGPGSVVPVVPARPQAKDPGCAAEFAKLRERLDGIGRRIDGLAKPTANPDGGKVTILADHLDKIRGRVDVLETSPPLDKSSGIPWGLLVSVAAGALGFGVPAWAITAYRGARLVKQLRDARATAQPAHAPPATAYPPPPYPPPPPPPPKPTAAPAEPPAPTPIHLGWQDAPPVRSTRNRYVRVERTDLEGEAYKEAIASWGEANPRTAGILRHIEELAQNIHHGKKVASRMRPQVDNPQITPAP